MARQELWWISCVIWKTPHQAKEWKRLNTHYHRSSKGGGEWEFFDLPHQWQIQYDLPEGCGGTLTFNLKPFSFKHTGLFPEQAANWDWFSKLIAGRVMDGREVRVLNLFAYTGGATLAAAAQLGTVEIIENNRNTRLGNLEDSKNNLLADCLNAAMDNLVQF